MPAIRQRERVEDRSGDQEGRDPKRLFLVIGLGALSWVATYVGMLELIEANLGDLAFIHKIIIGFSVAMLMTMIIWLLDKMFSPADAFTKACYVAGYLFLSIISVGFGFGFYWKVLESRGEASRSAESAITQVQSALFAASTRLEQLQSTLDQLTTISSRESPRWSGRAASPAPTAGRATGRGARCARRTPSASSSPPTSSRAASARSSPTWRRSTATCRRSSRTTARVIDAKTGNRNEFLRGVGRKLDLTVTGFNAFRSDPQLKQIRIDLADRAEKTTITGAKGIVISCPDGQLQMALRGVVRAIDQLPELDEAQDRRGRGLGGRDRGVPPPDHDLLSACSPSSCRPRPTSCASCRGRPCSRSRAAQASQVANRAPRHSASAFAEQAAGLAKRDYVPLAVAIFVDLCLLLVSIGRPVNQFVGLERGMREAEEGPVYPILARFHDIHADARPSGTSRCSATSSSTSTGSTTWRCRSTSPGTPTTTRRCRREAHRLANLCYALEGKGILTRPISFLPALVAQRQLKRRGSKFVECYGSAPPGPLQAQLGRGAGRCGRRRRMSSGRPSRSTASRKAPGRR